MKIWKSLATIFLLNGNANSLKSKKICKTGKRISGETNAKKFHFLTMEVERKTLKMFNVKKSA